MSQAILWPEKLQWYGDLRRVLVCGSRTVTRAHLPLIRAELELLPKTCVVVHGGQGIWSTKFEWWESGADMLASEIAEELELETECYPADWRLGRRAGPLRNQKMIELGADLVIAFWDGVSRGTAHTVQCAQKSGIPTRIVRFQ